MNASTNNLPLTLRTTNSGFTLIELMVTIAVLAIIVGIAAPSISTQLANQRVKSTTATLANALKEAKNESLIRRQEVEVSYDNVSSTIKLKVNTSSGSQDEITAYHYNPKTTINGDDDVDVDFKPNKTADAETLVICDIGDAADPRQILVSKLGQISIQLGGSC
ncbi:Tfp pilus assembly protein FimT/FimU [Psychrobacter sp. 1044]|uniref:pilus assembly FimT family protein n=1 Tax=Psychrobacter sp. 1044 TaxID=2772562 RepID=UPI001D103FA6|nr:prepilin-type N-terminal cleavage/methylation domain-containing protein [Psychrobacter sp. 1044]